MSDVRLKGFFPEQKGWVVVRIRLSKNGEGDWEKETIVGVLIIWKVIRGVSQQWLRNTMFQRNSCMA